MGTHLVDSYEYPQYFCFHEDGMWILIRISFVENEAILMSTHTMFALHENVLWVLG